MLTKKTDILRREVKAHIEADVLVRGRYWRGGKGCFIGCLTHSSNLAPAIKRFGLPVEVLRLAEYIFERLPADDAKAFFAAFPDAVACDGKDLSRVHWAFLAAELRMLPKQSDDVQAVIDQVIAGMDALASGGEWSSDAARASARATAEAAWSDVRATAEAAWSDVRAADRNRYAGYAGYFSVRAADAAVSAADVADYLAGRAFRAADATAYVAEYAAFAAADTVDAAVAADAARLAVIRRQRDLLLRLIKEAPMGETK
jgi:hypothetical protein